MRQDNFAYRKEGQKQKPRKEPKKGVFCLDEDKKIKDKEVSQFVHTL